jgi:ribosomal-protein-alanine N-acetyltransferase
MKIFAETDRLILREIVEADEEALFRLDSNPEVHRFLGNNPVKDISQIRAVIQMIRGQYADFGIGRWAVIEKTSGNFIGWCGMKYIIEETNGHIHFHDIGYRLIHEYWGKGYATESGKAALSFAFREMELTDIYGMTHVENQGSINVLTKLGLQIKGTFEDKGLLINWHHISKSQWEIAIASMTHDAQKFGHELK